MLLYRPSTNRPARLDQRFSDMPESKQSAETRMIFLGLLALALFAAVLIGVAIGFGEFIETPKR
jgi:hypothetical protein